MVVGCGTDNTLVLAKGYRESLHRLYHSFLLYETSFPWYRDLVIGTSVGDFDSSRL